MFASDLEIEDLTSTSSRKDVSSRVGPAAHASCQCAAHRAITERAEVRPERGSSRFWISALPVLACAFCPACLAGWAPLLASLGLGIVLPPMAHALALVVAIALSLGPAVIRARRAGTSRPLVLSGSAALVLLAGHASDVWVVELLGSTMLVVAGLAQHGFPFRTVRAGGTAS